MDGSGPEAMARVWSPAHQAAFARATGDVNPLHMDARLARRTLAGAPAVHGVHAALWALDACAAAHAFAGLSALQMRFERFVLVGDRTEIAVLAADARKLRLAVTVDGVRAMTVEATLAGRGAPAHPDDAAPILASPIPASPIPSEPIAVEPSAIADAAGAFRLVAPEGIAALAPRLAQAVGPARAAALGGLSTLVGMVVPGLHSILSKIDVTLTDEAGGLDLAYAVKRFQPLLQSVTIQARGPGLDARVESFVRPRPVEQEGLDALAALVRPGEFAGVSALVVGGSRGLGAATARLIAAGGGAVCLTYATGASEAEAVAQDIRGHGGRCQVLAYDAAHPAGPQLEALEMHPSQLYHFATPRIFRQKRAPFEPASFAEMMRVYNTAFYELCLTCLERGGRLSAFYPSTTAIDEAPRDTLEYVMAKSAGETLAAGLARAIPGLRVEIERLPRVRTDQTATIFPVPAAAPGALILPILRRLSSRDGGP